MRLTDAGPKGSTMAVSSDNIFMLLFWTEDQIKILDSILLPDIDFGEVWDIGVSGDTLYL